MKKKIIALTVAGSVLFGGVAGAAGSYYVSMINDYSDSKKQALKEDYNSKFEEIDKQIYNDSIVKVNEGINRIDAETAAYLQQKLQEKQGSRLNEYAAEIEEATDAAIVELKAYIDELAAGGQD
jgi:DNA-binding ferritin-like protein (Dps family)